MSSLTAHAMDRPSKVEVPRPISSSNTKESVVARRRMWATSIISIMKVERPRRRSSLAPTRVKMRSTKPMRAWSQGVKLPACARSVTKAAVRR